MKGKLRANLGISLAHAPHLWTRTTGSPETLQACHETMRETAGHGRWRKPVPARRNDGVCLSIRPRLRIPRPFSTREHRLWKTTTFRPAGPRYSKRP
ncbi:MAG: hypothetical protein ACLT8E_02790 [Akkermansia sp.]